MKVSVYKDLGGGMTLMVQASPGKGRSPVVIGEVTHKNLREKLLPAIEAMRLPRGPKKVPLP